MTSYELSGTWTVITANSNRSVKNIVPCFQRRYCRRIRCSGRFLNAVFPPLIVCAWNMFSHNFELTRILLGVKADKIKDTFDIPFIVISTNTWTIAKILSSQITIEACNTTRQSDERREIERKRGEVKGQSISHLLHKDWRRIHHV